MKQLLQSVATGKAVVAEVPAPMAGPGEVLVRVGASVVSAGTERMAVEFAEKSLVQKALARPDLVRQVLDKARREGILATVESVRHRLDSDLALGYSNAGVVIEAGEGVTDFKPGDRVACAGYGYASHAEIVRVPRNLVAKVPAARDGEVSFEEAAFATLGAIALEGLRLAAPQLGETVVVIGLGLIGLIAAQLAKAAGCLVLGMDINPERCRLAETLGCDASAADSDQIRSLVASHTNSAGADVVLIPAATSSSAPVELAGELARERGRVVVVGAVGLQIPRKPYYDKELSFQISRSYGPGRYDPEYEEKGHDYPIGHVRWTENRNMQAFLQLLAERRIAVLPLITHRFPIDEGVKAYDLISGKVSEPFLAVVLRYEGKAVVARRVDTGPQVSSVAPSDRVAAGLIGAGMFATGVLAPAMKQVPGVELVGVCAATGASARRAASKLGFSYCATDSEQLLADARINTIVIATRHHLHAAQVVRALGAGKHVFCEKPLCISPAELAGIVRAYRQAGPPPPLLMVGFNRRFAPLAVELHRFVRGLGEPILAHYRVNAGFIPPSHWTQDAEQGAGRIVGEVCHFVDFLSFLSGSLVTAVHAAALPNRGRYRDDNVAITLQFADRSIGTITYTAAGDKRFPKERVEVFGGGGVAVLDDFGSLELVRHGRARTIKSRLKHDKGHRGEWEAFAAALRQDGPLPIPFDHLVNSTLATFCVLEALSTGRPQTVSAELLAANAAGTTAR